MGDGPDHPVDVPPVDISTLTPEQKRAMLAQLLRAQAEKTNAGTDAGTTTEHALSYGQRALWFVHRLAPERAAYTVAYAGAISGQLDVPALERAAQALVDRHPMLRTTYIERDGQPVEQVHAHWPVRIAQHLIGLDRDELDGWIQAETDRPFDLTTGPMLRLTLLQRGTRDHVLVLAVHHIVVDFWSVDVILDELRALYAAEHGGTRPEQTADRYVDFAAAQNAMLDGPEGGQADATGEFMFGVQHAWRIRNGRLGELVRGVTISGIAFDVLRTVDAVSREFRWDLGAGYCGKFQPAKVDAGGPYLRCGVTLGGRQS